MKTAVMILAAAVAMAANAQTAKLTPVPSGFMPKMGGYMPQRLQLTADKPATVKKLPDGISNALYGELTIGGKKYTVCVGDVPGQTGQLFIDTKGNGDLSKAAPEWKTRDYTQRDGSKRQIHQGKGFVGFHLAGSKEPVSLGFYMFDPQDSDRSALKNVLLYYSDYGYAGEIKLGAKEYPILLTDDFASGDFRGKAGERSGVRLLIDRDGSGKFSGPGRVYDTHKPFSIDGTTYELAKISPNGGTLQLRTASVVVAEIPLPATFKVGQKFPGFKATTMDKNDVDFPTSYKGHIVMLDFWATWCGPCMGEVPNITAAYDKFHDKGFDILGVSLDMKDSAQKIADVTKDKNMTWPQIYDGGYWQAAIAVKYGIQSIPHAFLVDGDTGELLADGESLRGEGFSKVIEQFLTKKGLLKQPSKR